MSLHVGFLSFDVAKATIEAWSEQPLSPLGELLAGRTSRSALHLENMLPENEAPEWSGFHGLVEVSPARGVSDASDDTAAADARDLYRFAAQRGVSVVLVESYEGVLARFDATAAAE